MDIVDRETLPGCPTSKFLKKEEFSRYFPDAEHLPRRKNFLFKHKIPLRVDDEYGNLLLEKYPSLGLFKDPRIVAQPDELNNMEYGALKKLAMQYGMAWKETMIKKDMLIEKIRDKKAEGSAQTIQGL